MSRWSMPSAAQDADETVPENVPAANDLPLRVPDQALEVVVGLVLGQGFRPGKLALKHARHPPLE
jgi:hypothetical protein